MALNSTLTAGNADYTETDKNVARARRDRYLDGKWTLIGHVVTTTTRKRTLWTAATNAACELYESTYTPPDGAQYSTRITPQNLTIGSWQLEITESKETVTWEAAT